MSSVNLYSRRACLQINPPASMCSTTYCCHAYQNDPPRLFTKTNGIDTPMSDCVSDRSSNHSSIYQNPTGHSPIAWLDRTNISLRVKKYLKLMSLGSLAMNVFVACSNGRRMARPKLGSAPAPP